MESIMKVKQLENKNQFIMENNEKIIFQSYNSIIAVYNKKTLSFKLGKDWNYSRTTLKHLYIFIDRYVPVMQSASFYNSKNKKEFIQKLIDKKIISYYTKFCKRFTR